MSVPVSKLKQAASVVLAVLLSPDARRYEVAVAVGVYEAFRWLAGHP